MAQTSTRIVDDVAFSDEAWSKDDAGNDLLVRLYRPVRTSAAALVEEKEGLASASASAPLPAIIEIHGGTWSSRDRTLDENLNIPLASSGFVVAAIDFRQGPDHQHPAASRDVVAALRWLRSNAERLGIDPSRVGFMGTSSGGHLAMYAGVTPNAERHLPDGGGLLAPRVDPPKFVMALWPVSDPLARYQYAKRANMAHLVKSQDGFYGTEERMMEASVTRAVTSGEAEVLPPLLVVQPGDDANVPVEITYDLMKAWQGRDGYLEYAFFPNAPHALNIKTNDATPRLIGLLVDFARRHS